MSATILVGEQWVIHTCSWFISSLRPKWYFQMQAIFMYQQVIHRMLKAVITLVPLSVKSVMIFVPKDYPHKETIIWLASVLYENCFKQLKLQPQLLIFKVAIWLLNLEPINFSIWLQFLLPKSRGKKKNTPSSFSSAKQKSISSYLKGQF